MSFNSIKFAVDNISGNITENIPNATLVADYKGFDLSFQKQKLSLFEGALSKKIATDLETNKVCYIGKSQINELFRQIQISELLVPKNNDLEITGTEVALVSKEKRKVLFRSSNPYKKTT